MNKQLLNVEAVGLYTQPITFKSLGTLALKRFRNVLDNGDAGDEFDAIMIYPPPPKNSSNHVVAFNEAAVEVAVDPFYMSLSRELRTVEDVELHAVRQFDRNPKGGQPYNYYILTGSMLAAVQCIELLVSNEDVISELRHIAKTAIDPRGKLIRFPWRPECIASNPFEERLQV